MNEMSPLECRRWREGGTEENWNSLSRDMLSAFQRVATMFPLQRKQNTAILNHKSMCSRVCLTRTKQKQKSFNIRIEPETMYLRRYVQQKQNTTICKKRTTTGNRISTGIYNENEEIKYARIHRRFVKRYFLVALVISIGR